MNYSIDISTAPTTRLRTLQSATSSSSSSSSVLSSMPSSAINHNHSSSVNNINGGGVVGSHKNNFIVIAQATLITNNSHNNHKSTDDFKKHLISNSNLSQQQQQQQQSNQTIHNNHQPQPNSIIGQTLMMIGGQRSGHRHPSNTNLASSSSIGASSGPGEIEPLLSSTSSLSATPAASTSTSTTISPLHENYNNIDGDNMGPSQQQHHHDQEKNILNSNNNHDNNHGDEADHSIRLIMDHPGTSNSLQQHHHHRHHHNGGLNHHHHHINHLEGDSLHSSNEESSSLLMSNDLVIRTQTVHTSLKNILILNLLAFLFVSFNMILNLTVIAIIHERIPMDQPHLPDIAFDVLPDHRHFLDIAEYVICIQTFCIAMLLFFHKHRSTILRRICVIMGVIYFVRAICLASTTLPLASKNYYCSPQLKNSSTYSNITSLQFVEIIVSRVFYMSLGMGLSINGHHTFCGDYIFSGHTVILVLCYLIQQEYLLPSRRRTLAWKVVDIVQIIMTVTSVICILIARGHYLIDIIIAYYVTTRTFWIYHTLCNLNNNSVINIKSQTNYLNRVWWYPVFLHLENIKFISSSSMANYHLSNHDHHHHAKNGHEHHHHHHHHHNHHHQAQVQRIFEWPLPWPKRFVRRSKHHHHHRDHSTI